MGLLHTALCYNLWMKTITRLSSAELSEVSFPPAGCKHTTHYRNTVDSSGDRLQTHYRNTVDPSGDRLQTYNTLQKHC